MFKKRPRTSSQRAVSATGVSGTRLKKKTEQLFLECGATASLSGHVVTITLPNGTQTFLTVAMGHQNTAAKWVNRFNAWSNALKKSREEA